MHDHDHDDDAGPCIPDLARRVAAFLDNDAAGLPAVDSAWICDIGDGPTASLYLASNGTAAFRDLTRWADAFGTPIEIRPASEPAAVRAARTVITTGGLTCTVSAIITGTGRSAAADGTGTGHQEAA